VTAEATLPTATKTRSTRRAQADVEVDELPVTPPAEATDAERADWLDAIPDLDFLREPRARHRQLAREWAQAVDAVFEIRHQHDESARAWRAAVRAAVAVGDPAPEKPPAIDLGLLDGEVEIAVDDAAELRERLNFAAVEILGLMREHRVDLDLSTLSAPLLRAMVSGGPNQVGALAVKARERGARGRRGRPRTSGASRRRMTARTASCSTRSPCSSAVTRSRR
jgi:hypothetical protein